MKSLSGVGSVSFSSTISSPRKTLTFLKSQMDVWLMRIGIVVFLLVSVVLFKLLLDSQPSFLPTSLRLGLGTSSQTIGTNYPVVCTQGCCNPGESNSTNDSIRLPPAIFPNSYLPCKDYVKPGSSIHDLGNISKYFYTSVEDSELLHAAQNAATQPLPTGKPKIAFLFITRQKVPLEQMWERFFAEADEESYSIYTHQSLGVKKFPNSSVFHNTSIPSKEVRRFSISLVDVVRRLLSFALLDTARANMWFVLVSDACIPVRSFPYVYNYYMNSTTSFVEAFSVWEKFRRWQTEPLFRSEDVRKGELWMSMHRRHAGMVVGDVTFYRKFKSDCFQRSELKSYCVLDEMYTQTFLSIRDPQGIANRSVTYTDWHYRHMGSPRLHTAERIVPSLFEKIQNRTENLDGNYWDTSDDVNHTRWRDCVYNGQPHSPCFLFARKFSSDNETDVQALLQMPKSVLGY
ncbi:hypothetical protein M758_4G227800 [Ceratodon purpureus]|nr:hypothetical protein M758_4G227800 [Ceratodon purpureus]